MSFWSIVMLFVAAGPVPLGAGAGVAAFVESEKKNPAFMWMAGWFLLFSFFQVLAVPMILLKAKFSLLVTAFGITGVCLCLAGAAIWFHRMGVLSGREKDVARAGAGKPGRAEWALWIVFVCLLVFQMVMATVLSFGDGDDAYYVAVATIADDLDSMYLQLPYTGSSTNLDIRHCLAPFSVFIAFLARVCGMHAATAAHVAWPLVVLPLSYCVYGQIGLKTLKKRKSTALFLVFAEFLVMWGNYSAYSAETFLMIRSWQGKAVLACLVIPGMLLVMYMIGERLSEKKKAGAALWVLLGLAVTAACLCSTQGGVLAGVLLALFMLCLIFSYRSLRAFCCCAVCLLPAAVFVGMYYFMR